MLNIEFTVQDFRKQTKVLNAKVGQWNLKLSDIFGKFAYLLSSVSSMRRSVQSTNDWKQEETGSLTFSKVLNYVHQHPWSWLFTVTWCISHLWHLCQVTKGTESSGTYSSNLFLDVWLGLHLIPMLLWTQATQIMKCKCNNSKLRFCYRKAHVWLFSWWATFNYPLNILCTSRYCTGCQIRSVRACFGFGL